MDKETNEAGTSPEKEKPTASTTRSVSTLGAVWNECFRLIEFAIFAYIVAVAVSAIAEIAARQQFLSFLSRGLEETRAEIVDLTTSPALPSSSEKTRDSSLATSLAEGLLSERSKVEQLRMQLNDIQKGKRQTEGLIALGAFDPTSTLAGMFGSSLRNPEPSTPSWIGQGLATLGLDVGYLSSDHLLALAVIACGAIGALIGSIRSEQHLTFRYLSLGAASGFVAFLAIRGGKHLFLISSGADVASFNPYSCGFGGLLAGLFTERAYKLLNSVIDQFTKRIEQAMKG